MQRKSIISTMLLLCLMFPLGTLFAQEVIIGDVDGNGIVNIVDALKTAQFYVGVYPAGFNMNVADVSGDRTVNIVDALMIAQYYVGILISFPVEDKYRTYQVQLDAAREGWSNLALDDYEYAYRRLCFCPDAAIIYTVRVKNGNVTAVSGDDGRVIGADQLANFPAIEGLFDIIQTAITEKRTFMDLQFERVYSYPTSISIDYLVGAIDDEITYLAADLLPLRKAVIISRPGAALQQDPFSIRTAAITGNILSLAIQYSGGCREHEYIFYAADSFMESYPVQLNCYLYHNGFDDMCDAIITEPVGFDLTPIAELYASMYSARDTILLNIHQYFEKTPGKVIQLAYNPL